MANVDAIPFNSSVKELIYPPLTQGQISTLKSNFVEEGHLLRSIDTHTMLDCGPSRTKPFDDDPDTEMKIDDNELYLSSNSVVRQEFFGGILFNLDTHRMYYLSRFAMNTIFPAISPGQSISLSDSEWDSRAERQQCIRQLVAQGILTPSRPNIPTRFFPETDLSRSYLQTPFIVELEMTHGCFRKCRHCAYNASPDIDRSDELTTSQWKLAIEKIADAGVLNIRFTGGDFLFRKDALELLKFTDQLGISFHFLSDTVAISDRWMEEIVKLQNLDFIGTSLDGASAQSHDWMRGEGAFELFCQRARRISEAGLKLSVGATLHKRNWNEVRQMGRLATSLGATYFEVGFLCPIGRAESMGELVLNGDEVRKALHLYLGGLRDREYYPIQSHYVDRLRLDDPFADMEGLLDRLPYQTEWPFSRLRIKPSGVSYTAGKLKNSGLSKGINILHERLKFIWDNSPNLVRLREIGEGRRLHSLDIAGLPKELRDA